MFWNRLWNKQTNSPPAAQEVSTQCQDEAEQLFRSGKYHCAEAVLEVSRRHFAPELPESIVGGVSGLGGGSGSGSICGTDV